MREFDTEFGLWGDHMDYDCNVSEPFTFGSLDDDNLSPSWAVGERFEDRVDAAALAAWSDFRHFSGTVPGETAYDTIANLYFTLRRRLFQHAKRIGFTKGECGLFMDSLAARPIAARGHRQSAQLLNTQLKEALTDVPAFQIGCLQEAVKKVAVAIGASPRKDV
jgi:hypothetical protein